MTDICRDNGESYINEYKSSDGFIGYNEEEKIKENRDQFCKSIPTTIAKMDEIMTKCRNPYVDQREYYELKFAEKYYCTVTDTKTGKHCDEILDKKKGNWVTYYEKAPFDTPFRKWDSSLCDNSCIADLYPSIIELIKNLDDAGYWSTDSSEFNIDSSLFKSYNDNPANCCGTDDGTIGADTKCQADVTYIKTPLPEDIINGKVSEPVSVGSNSRSSNYNSTDYLDSHSSNYRIESNDDVSLLGMNVLGGFFLTLMAIIVLLIIAFIVAFWKIFSKAGEKGWKSLIPFYNSYVLFDITWKASYFWWIFLIVFASIVCIFIPVIGWIVDFVGGAALFVIGIMANYYLARSFGQGIGFTIGLVFLYPIFILILAYTKNYVGNGYKICQKEKAMIANQSTNVV